MIGHQHIGVHRTTELTRELAQVVQTKAVSSSAKNRHCDYCPVG